MRSFLTLLVLVALAAPAGAADTPDETEAIRKSIFSAMAEATDIDGQARVLATMVWMPEDQDPEVRAQAREILIGFQENGMAALRWALREVPESQQADVVRVLLLAMKRVPAGLPVDFLPTLDEALWFGTAEARRLAIPAIADYGDTARMLPVIDCAYENPELKPLVVESLGRLGNPRARYYLEEVLLTDPANRDAAAASLARLGRESLVPLKAALLSEDPAVRKSALQPLLEIAGPTELTALHEYVYRFPDDDPEDVAAARETAVRIEKAIEEYYATGDPEDEE